jgi:tRNA threonylcarbamoyladenosine biosynthesis protein TsaB
MPLLLMDTSTARCAVLVRAGGVDFSITETGTRGQDARLAPMVQEVLSRAGLGAKTISKIGVVVGPGAFTGVRIGVAFARGLGLALKRPVLGFNALDVFALGASSGGHSAGVCAIGRGELAYRLCKNNVLQGSYETAPVADAQAQILGFANGEPVHLAGSGVSLISGAAMVDSGLHDLDLARLADFLVAGTLPTLEALPWYHRPPDAKLPTKPSARKTP